MAGHHTADLCNCNLHTSCAQCFAKFVHIPDFCVLTQLCPATILLPEQASSGCWTVRLQHTACTACNCQCTDDGSLSALTQEAVASLVPLPLDQCVFVLVNLYVSIWAFHIPTPCLLQHRPRPEGLVTARPSNFATRPGYFGCYCSMTESRLCTTASAYLCCVSQTEVCHNGRTTSRRTATPWSRRQVKTSAQTTACRQHRLKCEAWLGQISALCNSGRKASQRPGHDICDFHVQSPG